MLSYCPQRRQTCASPPTFTSILPWCGVIIQSPPLSPVDSQFPTSNLILGMKTHFFCSKIFKFSRKNCNFLHKNSNFLANYSNGNSNFGGNFSRDFFCKVWVIFCGNCNAWRMADALFRFSRIFAVFAGVFFFNWRASGLRDFSGEALDTRVFFIRDFFGDWTLVERCGADGVRGRVGPGNVATLEKGSGQDGGGEATWWGEAVSWFLATPFC